EIFDAIIIKDEKHQELAGENVVLKSAIEFATAPDMWEEHGDLLEYKYLDWYVDVLNKALDGTPATTQVLNEIKAKGVEEFADNWQGKESHSQISEMARRFAASLRGEPNA
ncbi:hypothetical protein SM885_004647, partial [Yersinia enterocolitica]|nr:hypothetical protein [Yersinia enterocolitica]